MRLIHSILATIGMLVIAGLVVAAVADAWTTVLIAIGIAVAGGVTTSFAVPRDQREQLLERLRR
jgi:hypothetical protein